MYQLGSDGSGGTCDCIGLIIGALRRAGEKWDGIHGSNYAARNEMQYLLPVTDAEELIVGDIVYKAKTSAMEGYALPSRYAKDPDRLDYYHVGVVTGVNPLVITHCTGPGIVRDTKLGKWSYRGWLHKVATMGDKEVQAVSQAPEQRKLTTGRAWVWAETGNKVKMRSKPSMADRTWWNIPTGSLVVIDSVQGDWCKIHFGDRTGYMMSKYLENTCKDNGGDSDQDMGLSSAGDKVTVTRAKLEELQRLVNALLNGG